MAKLPSMLPHQLSWDDILFKLREIEKLLKRPLQRERFINQCIPKGHVAEKLFNTWNISLKSLRWQRVVEFIHHAACSVLACLYF